MGGRFDVRRLVTITLPGLVIALALVLLPSMGSSLVPTAALVAATPTATVVHLLGDEVAPALPAASSELRSRVAVPDDLLVAVLLATLTGLLAGGLVGQLRRQSALLHQLVPVPATPGRSPPHLRAR